MTGDALPPGVDEHGQIVDQEALKRSLMAMPPGVPGQKGLAALRKEQVPLETATEVYSALKQELRKLELAGERMAELRKLLHGYYTPEGDYVAGAEFEYREEYDEQVRDLYNRCNDTSVAKSDRPRWPGEDVRESIVNEFISEDSRQKLSALRGEMKALESYINVLKARAIGLSTLLAYHKEEMKMSGMGGSSPMAHEVTR